MAASVANPNHSGGDRRSFAAGALDIFTYSTPSGSVQSLDETDNSSNSSSNDTAELYGHHKHETASSPMMSEELLDREEERLKTFENFPHPWLDKGVLARCGFFYTGNGDTVKCQFCQIEVGRWVREDEPVAEHAKWSRGCPLLRRMETKNVPISAEELDNCLPALTYDVCGAYDYLEVHPYALPEDSISPRVLNSLPALNAQRFSLDDATRNLDAVAHYYPTYPEYAVESVRERSYGEWPRCIRQRPKQLADAGFFYTGSGDRVNCFSCGCGLKDWEESDDVWEQHTLWSPNCRFLKLLKGQNYIDDVLAQYAAKEEEAKKSSPRASEANEQSPVEATATVIATIAQSSPTGVLPEVEVAVITTTTMVTTSVATIATTAISTGGTVSSTTSPESVQSEHQSEGIDIGPSSISALLANTDFTDERLCKICYDAPYNTVFLPCGHVCACAKCATSVTSCPMCRNSFYNILRVCLP